MCRQRDLDGGEGAGSPTPLPRDWSPRRRRTGRWYRIRPSAFQPAGTYRVRATENGAAFSPSSTLNGTADVAPSSGAFGVVELGPLDVVVEGSA
jgi:hypothetical protein